jgi:hypothetical protein
VTTEDWLALQPTQSVGNRVVHLVDLAHVQPKLGSDALGDNCTKRHWNRVVPPAIDLDNRNDEFHAFDVLRFDKGVCDSGCCFVVAPFGCVVGL